MRGRLIGPESLAVVAGSDLPAWYPACAEIANHTGSEQVWWALKCGIEQGAKSSGALQQIDAVLSGYSDREMRISGDAYDVGFVRGLWNAFKTYVLDLLEFLRSAMFKIGPAIYDLTALASSVVVEGENLINNRHLFAAWIRVNSATPGSEEFHAALGEMRDILSVDHPETSAVVENTIIVANALSAVLKSIEKDGIWPILLAVVQSLGQIVGEWLEGIAASAKSPERFGLVVGEAVGEVTANLIILWFSPV